MAYEKVVYFLRTFTLLFLLGFLIYFYLLDIIGQYTAQLTNTASYEQKVTQVKPPTLTICAKPLWKEKYLLTNFNTTSLVFYEYDKIVKLNMSQLFKNSTFQLHQDYDLQFQDSLEKQPNAEIYNLSIGLNKIKENLKIEVESVIGLNNGQCYALTPKGSIHKPSGQRVKKSSQ